MSRSYINDKSIDSTTVLDQLKNVSSNGLNASQLDGLSHYEFIKKSNLSTELVLKHVYQYNYDRHILPKPEILIHNGYHSLFITDDANDILKEHNLEYRYLRLYTNPDFTGNVITVYLTNGLRNINLNTISISTTYYGVITYISNNGLLFSTETFSFTSDSTIKTLETPVLESNYYNEDIPLSPVFTISTSAINRNIITKAMWSIFDTNNKLVYKKTTTGQWFKKLHVEKGILKPSTRYIISVVVGNDYSYSDSLEQDFITRNSNTVLSTIGLFNIGLGGGVAATSLDNKTSLIIGGSSVSSNTTMPVLYTLRNQGNTLHMPTNPVITRLFGAAIFPIFDNNFIIAGGNTENIYDATPAQANAHCIQLRVDPDTGDVTYISMSGADLPAILSFATGSPYNSNRGLVFGGLDTNSIPQAKIYEYVGTDNNTAGTWTYIDDMLIPLFGASSCKLDDDRILITGGFTTGNIISDRVFIYNRAIGKMTEIYKLPQPLGYHSTVKLQDGRVFIIGGLNQYRTNYYGGVSRVAYNSCLNTVYEYDYINGNHKLVANLEDPAYLIAATAINKTELLLAGGANINKEIKKVYSLNL